MLKHPHVNFPFRGPPWSQKPRNFDSAKVSCMSKKRGKLDRLWWSRGREQGCRHKSRWWPTTGLRQGHCGSGRPDLPPDLHTWGSTGFSHQGYPSWHSSISSVVRAMVLWAIGRGLNPRMEHIFMRVPSSTPVFFPRLFSHLSPLAARPGSFLAFPTPPFVFSFLFFLFLFVAFFLRFRFFFSGAFSLLLSWLSFSLASLFLRFFPPVFFSGPFLLLFPMPARTCPHAWGISGLHAPPTELHQLGG